MATTTRALFRGAATVTTSTTLYTVPNISTSTVVTNIVVANTAASTSTVTMAIDGVNILPTVNIPANSVATFDMKQVIPANNPAKIITGGASTTAVTIHISGVEIN
jgi:hypothetical protein